MPCCRSAKAVTQPCNVFRLIGYRGDHRQFYHLAPVLDGEGKLIEKSLRDFYTVGDVNEWSEPRCECHSERKKKSCKLCERQSVFGHRVSNVPTNPSQNEVWRQDHYERNKGEFYIIWDERGKQVCITEDFLKSRRCGILSRAERISVPDEAEAACKDDLETEKSEKKKGVKK